MPQKWTWQDRIFQFLADTIFVFASITQFFVDLSPREHERVLQRDLDLLSALNCVEWPQSLAGLPDVIVKLFADEFVDFSWSFHMERWRKRDEVQIHDLEHVGSCIH